MYVKICNSKTPISDTCLLITRSFVLEVKGYSIPRGRDSLLSLLVLHYYYLETYNISDLERHDTRVVDRRDDLI